MNERSGITKVIMRQMKSMNYNPNERGICVGLVKMWIQAVLVDEEDKFNKRIEMIANHPNLNEAISLAQAKVKSKDLLSQEDQALLEIQPFFDGITLYQEPQAHQEVLGKVIRQNNMLEIAALTASKKLETQHQVQEVFSDLWIYEKEELSVYLNKIASHLKNEEKETKGNNFAFSVSFLSHDIGLRYNIENDTWTLLNGAAREDGINSSDIANKIFSAYTEPWKTGISLKIYSNNSPSETLKSELDKIREMHLITEDNVNSKSDLRFTLAHFAAKVESLPLIEKLADNKADFNAAVPVKGKDWTPIDELIYKKSWKCAMLMLANTANFVIKRDAGFDRKQIQIAFVEYVKTIKDPAKLQKILNDVVLAPNSALGKIFHHSSSRIKNYLHQESGCISKIKKALKDELKSVPREDKADSRFVMKKS